MGWDWPAAIILGQGGDAGRVAGGTPNRADLNRDRWIQSPEC